jgi:hypothetical protein
LSTAASRLKSELQEKQTLQIGGQKLKWVSVKNEEQHKLFLIDLKRHIYEHFLLSTEIEQAMKGCIVAYKRKEQVKLNGDDQVVSLTIPMFTYNGPWGIIKDVALDPQCSVDVLLSALKNHETVIKLHKDFRAYVQNLLSEGILQEWAYAIEVCEHTWATEQVARVHVHFWGILSPKQRWAETHFVFKDTRPFRSKEFDRFQSRTRHKYQDAKYSGAFYVQVEKTSTVIQEANVEMFQRYHVPDAWVTKLYMREKITAKVAERLYYRCVLHVDANLRMLRCVEAAKKCARLEKLQAEHQLQLQSITRGYRVVPEVLSWIEIFNSVKFRYTFLVLAGESQLGKTRYVYSLFPAASIFFVDCSGGSVDLKDFDYETHDVILLDEISVPMMIDLKKVLQAGPDIAKLGGSKTMVYSYPVYAYRKKFILCTNDWVHDTLASLKTKDRDWLLKNATVVEIKEHLCLPEITMYHDMIMSCTC